MKNLHSSEIIYSYILSCVDGESYEKELNSSKEKIEFLYTTFVSEKWMFQEDKNYYGGDQRKAFKAWMQGLPSTFNIAFENHEILAKAKEFGLLRKNASESTEDLFLPRWWDILTGHCFNLFSKYYTSKILTGMTTNYRGRNVFIEN